MPKLTPKPKKSGWNNPETKKKAAEGRKKYWDAVREGKITRGQKLPAEEKKPLQIAPDLAAELKAKYPLLFLVMNRAQAPFIRVKTSSGKTPRRRLFEAGNKIGKTHIGLSEDIAHMMGFRPWLKKDDPDYKIDIKVPNMGLIGCETMMQSVPQKIEPELRRLIPDYCKPHFKLNPQGVVKSVELEYDERGKKCGSVAYIRSYDQRPDTFEGIDYDWIHWDEPPPEEHLKAAERGKVVTNAPSWFTMTPLKEPYIYDQFTLHAFTHGGEDQEIAVIRGAIWDNCRDFCRDCNHEIPENAEVRTVKRCPKCNKIMGFIPKAGIDEYLKTLDPEEREARENGVWAHLSGLVYKELDREKHIYDDFTIPKNWNFIESIDPHDARPTRVAFGAISPEEIEINGKKRNRIYWFKGILADGNVDDIVRQIKAVRAMNNYQEPVKVMLDAKFGTKTVKTREDETSWQKELERAGLRRIVLSHSAPGDVELGHKIVREYLKPHYSALTSTAKPGMMFAKIGCGGRRGIINDMFNYQYDMDSTKGKPEEDYKDFPDCYDQETQVLTEKGWKYFSELDGSELVATMRLGNGDNCGGQMEFQKPYDYINRKYSGPMVKIDGRSLDLMVTPGHKMIYANAGGINYPEYHWAFKDASDITKWGVIPIGSFGHYGSPVEIEDWVFEFMGWYLAEGSATGSKGGKIQVPGRGYSIYISQMASSPNIQALHETMKKVPYHFRYDGRNFVISSKELWEKLSPLGNSHTKYIPDGIFNGTPRQLMKLWNCYMMGDGWFHRGIETACTVSKRLADDIQHLLSLAGYSSSIKERQPNESFIHGRPIHKENSSLQYHITRKTGSIAHLSTGDKQPIFSTVDYEGDIFCVTVPNHTLLVRRNNKPAYCGNCIRYAAMEEPAYRVPEHESNVVNMLRNRQNEAMRTRRFGVVNG